MVFQSRGTWGISPISDQTYLEYVGCSFSLDYFYTLYKWHDRNLSIENRKFRHSNIPDKIRERSWLFGGVDY
jgi:hypothetical protein